jgi:hypothetical protein
VINHAFPCSRILLLLRHPYPVTSSIVRWCDRGRLQETRNRLDYMFDIYRTQEAVLNVCPEAVRVGVEGNLKQKLVAHWFILNDFALKTIANCPDQSKAKILSDEAICKEPHNMFRNAFCFFAIQYSNEIQEYVRETSTHENDMGGLLTQRKGRHKFMTGGLRDQLMMISCLAAGNWPPALRHMLAYRKSMTKRQEGSRVLRASRRNSATILWGEHSIYRQKVSPAKRSENAW